MFGHDIVRDADAVRVRVALTGQFPAVDEELTWRENSVLLARCSGTRGPANQRAQELLEAFGPGDAASRLVKIYSGGMQRRLDLAASIIATPERCSSTSRRRDPVRRNQLW